MRNGWKTFAIGASADKCGGDTGYRLGTGKKNPKFMSASNLQLTLKIGRKTSTPSTRGFHRGCGLMRPWMLKRGRSFIRRVPS